MPTFNCTGAGTAITPLKRPYYCCGWPLPPLSFSGKWVCHKTGSVTGYCGDETGVDGVAIKFELESECMYNLGGNNTPIFKYVGVPENPLALSGTFLLAALDLCTTPDGFRNLLLPTVGTFLLFNPPVLAGAVDYTAECSFNTTTKEHYFIWRHIGFTDFGGGDTFSTSLILDTVELP